MRTNYHITSRHVTLVNTGGNPLMVAEVKSREIYGRLTCSTLATYSIHPNKTGHFWAKVQLYGELNLEAIQKYHPSIFHPSIFRNTCPN